VKGNNVIVKHGLTIINFLKKNSLHIYCVCLFVGGNGSGLGVGWVGAYFSKLKEPKSMRIWAIPKTEGVVMDFLVHSLGTHLVQFNVKERHAIFFKSWGWLIESQFLKKIKK